MAEKVAEGVNIKGLVVTDNNPISIAEFTNKFIEWIKVNNWSFDGVTKYGLKDKWFRNMIKRRKEKQMQYIWLFIPASLILLLINNYKLEKRIKNLEKVVKHYIID